MKNAKDDAWDPYALKKAWEEKRALCVKALADETPLSDISDLSDVPEDDSAEGEAEGEEEAGEAKASVSRTS